MKSKQSGKRHAYHQKCQMKYFKKYVFRLNTLHVQQLIAKTEKMENRTEWFKEKLRQETC